jgi:hypothetical protein
MIPHRPQPLRAPHTPLFPFGQRGPQGGEAAGAVGGEGQGLVVVAEEEEEGRGWLCLCLWFWGAGDGEWGEIGIWAFVYI